MTYDLKYMSRCLQLAQNGVGHVSPNPMVGAVLVCDDMIIGEGSHLRYGEAHAEPNAINSVKDKSLLKGLYFYFLKVYLEGYPFLWEKAKLIKRFIKKFIWNLKLFIFLQA